MVTQYDIEKKTFDYMCETGKKPRFVLLDSASYKAFNQSLIPKEKIEMFSGGTEEQKRVCSIYLAQDISLEILEINTPRTLFEVA